MAKKLKRKLTDQEWELCYEYVNRGDLMRAGLIAYPKLKTRSRAHAMRMIKRVMQRPRVMEEIDQMRADLRATQRLNMDQHLTILADIRDEAREAEQFAAAARCEELRGRVAGFYFEQHLHVHEPQMDAIEVKSKLKQMLENHPQLKSLLPAAPPKAIESKVVDELGQPVEDEVDVI